jgi:hypothetical protein
MIKETGLRISVITVKLVGLFNCVIVLPVSLSRISECYFNAFQGFNVKANYDFIPHAFKCIIHCHPSTEPVHMKLRTTIKYAKKHCINY